MNTKHWVLWAGLGLVGCGGSDLSPGAEASTGGELPPGMAKAMPAESVTAADAAVADQAVPGAHQPTILRPNLTDIPSVGSAGPPPPPVEGAPSEWGPPEADSGTPLPPRPPLEGRALEDFRAGQRAVGAGDLLAGQQAFEAALHTAPRAYQVLFALGVIADRRGQTQQALNYYRKSLGVQPDYERALDGAVKIYVRNGHPAQGVTLAESVARHWQRNLSVQAVYGEALVAAGQFERAEKVARAALRRDERFVPAMIVLARVSLQRGRGELATSILTQARELDPNHPEVHYLLGRSAEAEGQITSAVDGYRRAVEQRPEYAEARTALGRQYMASGNYEAALEQFQATLALVPMLPQAHLNLGDAYRALQRWDDARRAFETVLAMDSQLAAAHFNLGLMYMAAAGDYPGLDTTEALERARAEFSTYRSKMGPRLPAQDPSEGYLADVARRLEREEKRLAREARRSRTRAGGEGE